MNHITWVGSPNHYNGRNGHTISHITLHIMVGTLAGTDSVFQRTGYASAHYGIGGNGEIHQYVSESDGSWSDANYASNNSTVSVEHEGGMAGVPCTRACMDASARLCADIARRQSWDHLWYDGLNGNVWLHREIPGTDHAGCPDLAPNGLDVNYVINKANEILQGGDTMTTAQITEALYTAKGNDGRNIFDSVIQTRNELKDRATEALYTAKGLDGRNIFDSVIQTRYDIAALKTTLAAQATAIETLSKELGANPADIAATVEKAVKNKLDALEITVSAKGKTEK
jgi:hypothetical protein|nr:MAG TPA: N-acetylmuramoyl-L-alanine amidase [Caudoviricetes sp.]